MTRISASIHPSTSCCSCSADLLAELIAGPIEKMTVPGCLMKLFFGQQRPALCAIGITRASVALARRAPPLRYGLFDPMGVLVPSGKSMIHLPSLKRFLP